MEGSKDEPFLKTGTILESFNDEGNCPVVKERLIISARGGEISGQINFKIFVGILFGPDALLGGIEWINLDTSSGVTGERNIDLGLGWFKNDEKCLSVRGILDLIVSATELKYELNSLATAKELEVTASPILSEIGLAEVEVLREIIFLTPCQIFRILLTWVSKYLAK